MVFATQTQAPGMLVACKAAQSRVTPCLQLLRRPQLWRSAVDTCATAAQALAFAAGADAAIASELQAAGAVALAAPMLAADMPQAVAAGAAALIEYVALSDPAAGLAAAVEAGAIKPLAHWLRVPATPDLRADFAAGDCLHLRRDSSRKYSDAS